MWGICGPRERLRSHSEQWGSSSDQRAGVSPSSFPGIFLQSSPFLSVSLLQSPLEFLLPVYKYPQVPPIVGPKPSPSVASPPPHLQFCCFLLLSLNLCLQSLHFLRVRRPSASPCPIPTAGRGVFQVSPRRRGRVCVCVCVCVWCVCVGCVCVCVCVSNPASQFVNRTLALAIRQCAALRVFCSCNGFPNHFRVYCLFGRGG